MYLPAGLGVVPAVSGMVNWVPHEILLSPSFSWWFPPSPLIWIFLNHHLRTRSWFSPINSLCDDHELTLNTAYTKYCIHRVLHTRSTASSEDGLTPAPSQSLIFRRTILYSTLYIPMISRCSQARLELSKVLSDSTRAFSCAPESTCSNGGAFRMLQDLTYRIVKFWSSWNLFAGLRETSRAAGTAVQLCGRLGARFSPQWLFGLHNQPYGISSITFVFVSVTRFAT